MKYLSLFSGIEAATVAWEPLGWEPIGFAEIEKFPNKVLAHHYPDVKNYGNVLEANFEGLKPDLIVFGSPCQSFSVAGKRLGLDDPRGNLALVALEVVARLRPRWFLFENVPGLLSSGEGRDFGQFLAAVGECGYQCAWRILDAQYFGVPQRRRRVFVVASSRDWRDSAKVLFEPESLLRNPPPSRGAGQVAPTVPSRSTAGGGLGTDFDCDGGLIPNVANPLTARMHKGINTTCDEGQTPIVMASGQANAPTGIDVCPALTCLHEAPIVGALIAKGPQAMGAPEVDASEDGTGRGTPILPTTFNWQNGGGYGEANEGLGIAEDQAGPESASQVQAVAFAENQRGEARESAATDSLKTSGGKPGQGYQAVRSDMAVRRLTPLECERLQGFPDNYTNIPKASDSARYKALGNSMAVPVMNWIGRRINEV